MKKMKMSSREILWFAMGIMTLLLAIILSFKSDFKTSYPFFIFSFVSFLLYYIRRKIRKNKKTSS